ncbi:hypothetical protein NQ318_018652, partial [Aromia moschata]
MLLPACCERVATNLNKTVSGDTLSSLDKPSVEEIEKNAFDNEEEVMQIILTEKENDASVRSRLSKECNTLLADKKISLTGSSGLNLHLENKPFKGVGWETYEFSNTADDLKKQSLSPAVMGICKDTPGAAGPPSASPPRSPSGSAPASEWWKFFLPKTGVTGFWTFLFTCGTWLVSKEYYVLEHNYYGGLSIAVLWYYAIKHVGPLISNFLDKGIDSYEKGWQKGRDEEKEHLQNLINDEQVLQFQADGQLVVVKAKRENVALQLEDEFRQRQMHVYEEVKKRLDYHVAVALAHRKIVHKNLVEYVTREVEKSITPEMQKQLIDVSIESIISEFEKG